MPKATKESRATKQQRYIYIVACMTGFILLLTSCSKLEFFYRRMDWLIPHLIGDYVDLDSAQEKLLDEKVKSFINWHCSEEIPKYVVLVGQWRHYADSGKLQREQYVEQRDAIMSRFHALGKKAAIEMDSLVRQMSEKQLKQFIKKIDKDNQKIKEDFIDADLDKIQSNMESRLIERYERWVGSLNQTQLAWVKETSFKLLAFEKARYDYRRNWLTLLEDAWLSNKNMDSIADFLYYTVTDRERFWSSDYRTRYFDRNKENELLTLKIMNSLTAKQLDNLKYELEQLQSQLQQLTCQ